MPFQRVPETAIVETLYSQGNKIIEMTFYSRFVGGYSQGDIDTLAFNADNRVGLSFLPIQTAEVAYLRTEVRGLDQINDLFGVNSTEADIGANVSGGLPNQVTYAVQRNAGLTGRSSRGRVYWIGLAVDDLADDENFLVPVEAVSIVGAIDNMRGSLELNGWAAVIVSRVTGGVPRDPAVTFNWENTVGSDERVDTLRGRLP